MALHKNFKTLTQANTQKMNQRALQNPTQIHKPIKLILIKLTVTLQLN